MKNNNAGFTLLEVILSIALLTTIVMLTINVLSSEISLRQKIIDRYPFDKIINRITQDISGAITLPDSADNEQINFIHSSKFDFSTLSFSVLNHESLIADTKESNLARIVYTIDTVEENGDTKNQLIRIVDTAMEEGKVIPDDKDVGIRTVLAEDVKEFKLTFWKQDDFLDTWNSTINEHNEQGRLPKMVKIELTLYIPNKQNNTKQELKLQEIIYVRNSQYPKRSQDLESEKYSWQ